MPEPVYLAVHVPEFSAQALLRLRPELRRKPVAVVKGIPPLQQVCSANAMARAMGVENGMTRAQLDAFDGLTILPASTAEESCARSALLEAAAVFTPRIELHPVADAACAVLLDMTGTTWMWGETAHPGATCRTCRTWYSPFSKVCRQRQRTCFVMSGLSVSPRTIGCACGGGSKGFGSPTNVIVAADTRAG